MINISEALIFIALPAKYFDNPVTLQRFLCHPGGAKVIDALESIFELPSGGLADSRAVLREHGNMSAATVMFVLEHALEEGARGHLLLSSLGPGFTAAFAIVDAH